MVHLRSHGPDGVAKRYVWKRIPSHFTRNGVAISALQGWTVLQSAIETADNP